MIRSALLVLLVALAGCSDAPAPAPAPQDPTAIIQGFVFDAALRPVDGAVVLLGGTGITDTTDAQGAYRIEAPGAQPVYALRVTAPGFHDATATLQSPAPSPRFTHNVTLARLPVQEPFHETQPWTGNLACAWFAQAQHSHGGPGDPGSHNSNDCSQGTNDDVRLFDLKPGVRNAVVELRWEPNAIISDRLAVFVEGPGVDGGDDALFYFNEGTSPLRATISQLQANTFYRDDGGPVRVTVKIGAPEDDVAAGVAINQEFDLFLTAFYVLPGSAEFSIEDAA